MTTSPTATSPTTSVPIDDTTLLPSPQPLPALTDDDAMASTAQSMFTAVMTAAPDHLADAETLLRLAGIQIWDSSRADPQLVAAGAGKRAAYWLDVADVLAVDHDAPAHTQWSLKDFESILAAALAQNGQTIAVGSAAAWTWLDQIVTDQATPDAKFRHALFAINDTYGEDEIAAADAPTLQDAVASKADYQLDAIQYAIILSVVRGGLMAVAAVASTAGTSSPGTSSGAPSTSGHPTTAVTSTKPGLRNPNGFAWMLDPPQQPAAATDGGCFVDNVPDAVDGITADVLSAVYGGGKVAELLKVIGGSNIATVMATGAVSGIITNLAALLALTAGFTVDISDSPDPFTRTKTATPGASTTVSAHAYTKLGWDTQTVNCYLRLLALTPGGYSIQIPASGDITGAKASFEVVGDGASGAAFADPDTRTDQATGIAKATLTGKGQTKTVDDTAIEYQRDVVVRVTVHPATQNGRSTAGAVVNAILGDIGAAGGYSRLLQRLAGDAAEFEGAALISAAILATGQFLDTQGVYNGSKTLHMNDWGHFTFTYIGTGMQVHAESNEPEASGGYETGNLHYGGTASAKYVPLVRSAPGTFYYYSSAVPLIFSHATYQASFTYHDEPLVLVDTPQKCDGVRTMSLAGTSPGTAQVDTMEALQDGDGHFTSFEVDLSLTGPTWTVKTSDQCTNHHYPAVDSGFVDDFTTEFVRPKHGSDYFALTDWYILPYPYANGYVARQAAQVSGTRGPLEEKYYLILKPIS